MKEVDRPITLAAATARNIREAVMKGDFHPGDPLREIELSKSLNISRGTVREALRLLHKQGGVVEIHPHRGAFVAQLSPKNVEEIYTIRGLLEPYAVRLAIERGAFDERSLEELDSLVRTLAELEQKTNSRYSESVEADMRFHWLICQGCQHRLLLDFLGNLQSQTQVLIMSTKMYRSDQVADSISHQMIVDGIRTGDPAAAEQVVRRHIIDAGSALVKRMQVGVDSNRGNPETFELVSQN